MKVLLLICTILISNSCFAKFNKLHLSNKVFVEFENSKIISHSGSLLILKFDDWYFSHEVINPETYYQPIDLTDIEHAFLKSIFDPNLRGELPNWLGELAMEQASSFGVSRDNTLRKVAKDFELLAVYDSDVNQGNIFIFEEYQVHHINFSGRKKNYISLINSIQGKQNDTIN